MASTQKIMELIENGDCLSILAEDSLRENFNELLKYGLIDIVEDKVVLTKKGAEAKILGIEKAIVQMKSEKKLKEVPVEKQQQRSTLYTAGFGFLFFLCVILLIACQMGYGLTK